jgi:hypothetical protein
MRNFYREVAVVSKKIPVLLAAAVFCVAMGTSAISNAYIAVEKIGLGGLTPNSTVEDMKKLYGEPDQTVTIQKGDMISRSYTYGKHVSIVANGVNGTERTSSIIVKQQEANNRWTTPAGIGIGMKTVALQQVYGKPDSVFEGNNLSGLTFYVYRTEHGDYDMTFGIKDDAIVSIAFHTDANGVIK